jgi:16S rRNA (cytosine1402-N4)-methyltransferase
MQELIQHTPVLLEEAVKALKIRPEGIYLDGTYGRGGHTRQILSQLGERGRLLVLDRDPQAIQVAKQLKDERMVAIQENFARLDAVTQTQGLTGQIDGILLDLGVSSPQLIDAQRGFSFLHDGPLDMRMDPTQGHSAAEWLNQASEQAIADVLWRFGEERFARRIAKAIVSYRATQPLTRTAQLAAIVSAAMPRHEKHKHAATRSFQAVRIYINDELAALQQALEGALQVLASAGRLVVISFHSLEDRLVKQFMRQQSSREALPPGLPLTEAECQQRQPAPLLRVLGKQRPSKQEIASNPQARSALLRIAERCSAP